MSIKHKREFDRVRDIIRSEGKAVVRCYDQIAFKDVNYYEAIAYISFGGKVANISILSGNKKYGYKDQLVSLLHEYGHCIDFEKNKKLFRWEEATRYDFGNSKKDLEKAVKLSKKIKRCILKNEFYADKEALKFIKKWDVDIDKREYIIEFCLNLLCRKYEMQYGQTVNKTWAKEQKKTLQELKLELNKSWWYGLEIEKWIGELYYS